MTATKGSYAAVTFCPNTVANIQHYVKEFKIPAPVKAERLHSTVLYSRKFCPGFVALGKLKKPLVGRPVQFHKWEIQGIVGSAKQYALVLEFDCPELVQRHKHLMQEHSATWDYAEYIPHLTISYDVKDLNIFDLPPIDKYLGEIRIVEEYGEELDLDWARKN